MWPRIHIFLFHFLLQSCIPCYLIGTLRKETIYPNLFKKLNPVLEFYPYISDLVSALEMGLISQRIHRFQPYPGSSHQYSLKFTFSGALASPTVLIQHLRIRGLNKAGPIWPVNVHVTTSGYEIRNKELLSPLDIPIV